MLPAHIPLLDAYVKNTCHDLDIESELFETTYYHQDNESSEDYRVKIGQILPSKSIHEYIGGPDEAINDFRNKVLEFHPDIIGVSVTDFTHRIGERLIEGHREWYSKPHICVVGGVFCIFWMGIPFKIRTIRSNPAIGRIHIDGTYLYTLE